MDNFDKINYPANCLEQPQNAQFLGEFQKEQMNECSIQLLYTSFT